MIETESRDGVCVVRLNRAAERNALIPPLLAALVDSLRAAAALQRPVVLTSNGPAFCVGADLDWLAGFHDPSQGVAELVAVHHLAISTIVDMPAPVIAAVNGAVAGGGLGLALAPDYCIASRNASFTTAYLRLGLTPDGGSSTFLERALGPVRARELLLTNRRLSAEEAVAWGLINEVVAADQLLDRAVAFAANIPTMPSYAVLETRRLLDASNLRNQLQLESVAIRTAARGEFFKAALRRFRESHPG